MGGATATVPTMSDRTTGGPGGTGDLFELSDAILRGEADIAQHHPFSPSNTLVEADDGVAFVESFANVSAFSTRFAGTIRNFDIGQYLEPKEARKCDPFIGETTSGIPNRATEGFVLRLQLVQTLFL